MHITEEIVSRSSPSFRLQDVWRRTVIHSEDGATGSASPHAADTLGNELAEYAAGYRALFPRSDQFLRFRAYLRGLLEPSDRKNVAAIALAAYRANPVEANL